MKDLEGITTCIVQDLQQSAKDNAISETLSNTDKIQWIKRVSPIADIFDRSLLNNTLEILYVG